MHTHTGKLIIPKGSRSLTHFIALSTTINKQLAMNKQIKNKL